MRHRVSAGRGAARFPVEEGGCNAPPLASQRSPFAVLGVPRDASATQVKQAYRRLCAKYHPDARARGKATENLPGGASNSLPPAKARIDEAADFLEIQRAYRTLKDRYARAQWERIEQDRERRRVSLALEGGPDPAQAAPQPAAPAIRNFVELMMQMRAALPAAPAETFAHPMARFWLALGGCALTALLFWVSSSWKGSPRAGVRIHPESASVNRLPREFEPRAVGKRPPTAASTKVIAMPPIVAHTVADTGLAESGNRSDPEGPETIGDSPRGTPADSLEESSSHTAESAANRPADSPHTAVAAATNRSALPETASRGSSPPSPEAPSKLAEWHGRWVAICSANRGADLYRGTLEIADRGRFRWMNLGNGATGRIGQLVLDASSDGDLLLRPLPGDLEGTAGQGTLRGGVRAVATLEQRPSSGRWLRWREDLVGGDERASGRRASEADSANQPALVCPCPRWRLFADDGDAALEGLWVLPAGDREAEGLLAAEYAELRMARKADGFAGLFVGRYRVPVDSMPPEMRFGFVAPVSASGWHAWQTADGIAGKVLLAPIGRSRLAVIWKRGPIPSGRPALSGGVAVLRRME